MAGSSGKNPWNVTRIPGEEMRIVNEAEEQFVDCGKKSSRYRSERCYRCVHLERCRAEVEKGGLALCEAGDQWDVLEKKE